MEIANIDSHIKWYRGAIFRNVCFALYFSGMTLISLISSWANGGWVDPLLSAFYVLLSAFQIWFALVMHKRRQIWRAYRLNAIRANSAETPEQELFFLIQCMETLKRI